MKTINDYAQLVKKEHALNKTIAPVETNASDASQSYAIGEQFILDGILRKAKTAIAQHDALVYNTNYEDAGDIVTQIANEAATRSALGAKNILPFDLDAIKELNTAGTWASNVYSYRGVDFTVNPDGTILADGQATGGNASIKVFAATSSYEMRGKNVVLNGCPSGGSATTYRIQAYRMGSVDGSSGTYFDDGDGTVAFDALNNASGTVGSFAVAVYENYDADNLLFKPMVRLATDSDGTYQPYAKTNKELTDDVSSQNSAITNLRHDLETFEDLLGAKNLLPDNLTTQTVEGVTFTVNADGSITVNGTVTPDEGETATDIVLPIATDLAFFASDISLESTGIYTGTDYIFSQGDNGTNGVYLSYVAATGTVNVNVEVGTTVNNVTIYPMIRLVGTDSIYEPYAMTNREITHAFKSQVATNQITNPNLLENSWFTVNQRGKNQYTGTTTVYTVDRWRKSSAAQSQVDVNSDGSITFSKLSAGNAFFVQHFEDSIAESLVGKKVTLTLRIVSATVTNRSFIRLRCADANNTLIGNVTRNIPSGFTGDLVVSGIVPAGTKKCRFEIFDDLATDATFTVTVKAAKVEIGSISTLGMDIAPIYEIELAKCMRYFIRLTSYPNRLYGPIGTAIVANDTGVRLFVPLPAVMRAAPTVTFDTDSGKIMVFGASTAQRKSVTNIALNQIGSQSIVLTLTTESLSGTLAAGDACECWFMDTANAYIDLSADL